MPRTVYYTAATLDGFLADEQDSLAWLLGQDIDPDGAMSYERFVAGVGAVVMGATTYRWIREQEPDAWPYTQPTWVLTHREPADLPPPLGDVRLVSGDVRVHHPAMREAAGERDVWVVGGGDVAGQVADAGLLDELLVQVAPVTLGAGRPLLPRRLDLRLFETERNASFVCSRYAVTGPGDW